MLRNPGVDNKILYTSTLYHFFTADFAGRIFPADFADLRREKIKKTTE